MPLLVESLRADDGCFADIAPHIQRMMRSRRALFGLEAPLDLATALEDAADRIGRGIWKVRVLYDTEIRRVDTAAYERPSLDSAVLVDGQKISYPNKTVDRVELDRLSALARNGGGDTALIVRNGLITDFSYANAAFFDGSAWWTPGDPLLQGTRRARLLAENRLATADIRPGELHRYTLISPINAMLDLGEVTIHRIIDGL